MSKGKKGSSNNYETFLQRAFICLEDGDFEKADELLERVLDLNPICASAYIGKLMVELELSEQEELSSVEEPLTTFNNYNRAIQYADDNYKKIIESYNMAIINRIKYEEKILYKYYFKDG